MIPQNLLLAFLSLQAQDQGRSGAPQSSQLGLNVFDSVSNTPESYQVKEFHDFEPTNVETHDQQSLVSNEQRKIHRFPVSLLLPLLMKSFLFRWRFIAYPKHFFYYLVRKVCCRPLRRPRPPLPWQRKRTRTYHHKHNLSPLEPSRILPLYQPQTRQ